MVVPDGYRALFFNELGTNLVRLASMPEGSSIPLGDFGRKVVTETPPQEVAEQLSQFVAAYYGKPDVIANVRWTVERGLRVPRIEPVEGALYVLYISAPVPQFIYFFISGTHLTRATLIS